MSNFNQRPPSQPIYYFYAYMNSDSQIIYLPDVSTFSYKNKIGNVNGYSEYN